MLRKSKQRFEPSMVLRLGCTSARRLLSIPPAEVYGFRFGNCLSVDLSGTARHKRVADILCLEISR